MRVLVGLGCVAGFGLMGCASTSRAIDAASVDAARSALDAPSVRVGEAHFVDARVNPLVPFRLALKDGSIAVSFARLGGMTSEPIDPTSLEPRPGGSGESPGTGRDVESTSNSVQRIPLDGGRFLVCWTTGSLEWGHRAMAQIFNSSDGSPRGGAVAISPSDADVIGLPRAITSDGNKVVAMFAAMSGSSFELMAVPLEDAAPSDNADQSARR